MYIPSTDTGPAQLALDALMRHGENEFKVILGQGYNTDIISIRCPWWYAATAKFYFQSVNPRIGVSCTSTNEEDTGGYVVSTTRAALSVNGKQEFAFVRFGETILILEGFNNTDYSFHHVRSERRVTRLNRTNRAAQMGWCNANCYSNRPDRGKRAGHPPPPSTHCSSF